MIKLESAALTDQGRARSINEDHVWTQLYAASEGEPTGLFIVCDGVGGHLGGECASYWATETVKHELASMFCQADPRATVHIPKAELESVEWNEATRLSAARKIENQIVYAIQKANQVVYDYAQQKPQQAADAGTTITMAVIQGDRAVVANVGDSRTYLLQDGRLRKITRDHSLVATLVANGQIQPEEIYVHPQRNLIYRSLGNKQDVKVDTFIEAIKPGDTLLLCSDGLWEMVQDEGLIARLIEQASTPAQACQKLADAANAAGGEDNIAVIIVKVT